MGVILKYLKEFYEKEFQWPYFILMLLLVGTIIYLNYWHFLEIKIASGRQTWAGRFGGYYALYFIPFFIAFLLQILFIKEIHYFKSLGFWVILLVAPAIFSFRVNFDFFESWIQQRFKGDEQEYWLRCINFVIRVFVIIILVSLVWWVKDRHIQPLYGIRPVQSYRPYAMMLLIMIPLIMAASTQRDFLHMYPKGGFINSTELSGQKWRYLVYELCYGFDFVSIEFFFRGFMILSLIRICGTHAIIPVAVFYSTIHLGKPMGEAISSFFGGMVLGIVSYQTGTIWGGLMVHLGIAWLMELGGWIGGVYLLLRSG